MSEPPKCSDPNPVCTFKSQALFSQRDSDFVFWGEGQSSIFRYAPGSNNMKLNLRATPQQQLQCSSSNNGRITMGFCGERGESALKEVSPLEVWDVQLWQCPKQSRAVPAVDAARTETNIQRPSCRRLPVSQEDQGRNRAFIPQRLNYTINTWVRRFVVTL